jgi:hypothetical protein
MKKKKEVMKFRHKSMYIADADGGVRNMRGFIFLYIYMFILLYNTIYMNV